MDVRERILEAALHLLGEQGVAELTQPRVARAAGVTQSHLTYYFPTRHELLLAVAQRSVERELARLVADVEAAPEDRLDRAAKRFASALTDKRRARMILGLIIAADEQPAIRAALRDFVARVRAMLAAAAGAMGMHPDPRRLAALHAAMVGVAVLNLARDDRASHEEAKETPRLILALLAGQSGTRKRAAKRAAGRRA